MKRILAFGVMVGAALGLASAASAQQAQTLKGLQISVAGVEHMTRAGLSDCPAGANSQAAMARGGEEMAVVTLKITLAPGYQPTVVQRPTAMDGAGNTYRTAASFVDLGKTNEFSCGFPFRVPAGTTLKTIHIETLALTLPEPTKAP